MIQPISTTVNVSALFDADITTCVNVEAALTEVGYYKIDLIIQMVMNNGLVRVYFSDTVRCGERKVSPM